MQLSPDETKLFFKLYFALLAYTSRASKKPAPDWRPIIDEIVNQVEKMRAADTQTQKASLSMLRAVANLTQAAVQQPEEIEEHLRKFKAVRRGMTQLERLLEAKKYGFADEELYN